VPILCHRRCGLVIWRVGDRLTESRTHTASARKHDASGAYIYIYITLFHHKLVDNKKVRKKRKKKKKLN